MDTTIYNNMPLWKRLLTGHGLAHDWELDPVHRPIINKEGGMIRVSFRSYGLHYICTKCKSTKHDHW